MSRRTARPEPGSAESTSVEPAAARGRARARRRDAVAAGWPRAAVLAVVLALLLPAAALAEEPAASPAADPAAAPAADPAASPTPTVTPAPAVEPAATPLPAAEPTPAPSPTPGPTSSPAAVATPAPSPVVVSRNLYRVGAVVTQYTNYWCVPAAVQTMVNLVLGTRDRSYATQKLLASVTYRFNRYRYPGPGNDIRGWAGALNWRLPDGLPVVYRDRSYATRYAALHAIVDAIDETGYPVGITVWHGGHAWSVVGYRISQVPGDPATRVFLGFYVVGPLGSPRDPWPVRYVTLATFGGNYTRYYEDGEREPWHLDYVVVRPERTASWSRDWPRP